MKHFRIFVILTVILSIIVISDTYAQNAKMGDGFITCNLDSSTTDKGEPFTKANLVVSNTDASGNYIYKGVMVGTFEKGDTEWNLVVDNSVITDSLSIEVTDFGDITKYQYDKVYVIGYKIMYEAVGDPGPIITTEWNILDGSYFKPVTIVLPTLDTVEVSGPRAYGEDVVLKGTGKNIVEAAYRIYYTDSETVPLIEDKDNDGNPDGWQQPNPEVRMDMTVESPNDISGTVLGSNLSDTTWTYVTFKVAVASSSGTWIWKFTPAYSLGGSGGGTGGGIGGYLNYVGHNQLKMVNGANLVLVDPFTPDPTYGPYDWNSLGDLDNINKCTHNEYLKYRIEFDVVEYQKIKDIKIILDLNQFNERNIEFLVEKMNLLKRREDGSFAVYKVNLPFTAQGRNRYIVALGREESSTLSMIEANGAGRYAVQYEGTLKVYPDLEDTLVTIRHEAQIRVCIGYGKYDEIIEPDRPSNKFFIETKVSRLNVKYG